MSRGEFPRLGAQHKHWHVLLYCSFSALSSTAPGSMALLVHREKATIVPGNSALF
jgi:hypothetical protein